MPLSPSPSPSSSAGEPDWSSDSQASSLASDEEEVDLDERDEQDDDDHFRDGGGSPNKDATTPTARRSSVEKRNISRRHASFHGNEHSGSSMNPSGRPLRGPRLRNTSFSGGSSGDQPARAYAETLRTTRLSSHRGSISIAAGGNAAGAHLSEDTRRRHRESKKRMEFANLTQKLLFRAQEQDQIMDGLPLWLHASIIPPRWRIQIMEHLTAINEQVQFCRERVVHVWHFLYPPFDRANVHEYEKRLKYFEKSVVNLDAAIQQCEEYVVSGERLSACVFLQFWFRRCLAKKGFYTKTITMSRQYRGLIPGMFDTIAGTSRLTIHKRTRDTTLEYPTAPVNARHAFLS